MINPNSQIIRINCSNLPVYEMINLNMQEFLQIHAIEEEYTEPCCILVWKANRRLCSV